MLRLPGVSTCLDKSDHGEKLSSACLFVVVVVVVVVGARLQKGVSVRYAANFPNEPHDF